MSGVLRALRAFACQNLFPHAKNAKAQRVDRRESSTKVPAENLLMGLVAMALLPLIGWRIVRGLRDGRLPLYRTHISREESGARFGVLLVLHALSFLLIAAISADLLFNLGLRNAL